MAISTPSSFAAALARSWLRRDIKKLGRSRRKNQGRTNPAVTADRNVSGGHDHGVVCHGITLLGIHCISTWHGTAGLAWHGMHGMSCHRMASYGMACYAQAWQVMFMGRQKAKRAEAKSMATNVQKEHAQLKAANEKLKKKVEDLKKELAEERDMRIMAEGEIENTKAALRYFRGARPQRGDDLLLAALGV